MSLLRNTIGKPEDDHSLPPAAADQDRAGEAAIEKRGISKTAFKNAQKNKKNGQPKPENILRFGLDWLTVNFMKIGESKFIEFLDNVFQKYDPESPYGSITDVVWAGTNVIFPIVKFGRAQGDIVAYFQTEYDSVIVVKKIAPDTKLRGIGLFHYRVTFYGTFFALEHQNRWKLADFLQVAFEEINSGKLFEKVAEVHVCIDIANTTTDWFDKGIKRLSDKLKKKITRRKQDPETGLYETIDFGEKFAKRRRGFQATDWGVLGYDKLKSIRDEGDEGLYPQYLQLDSLLRIEAFFKSIVFRKYKFTLHDCLDKNALFALLDTFLRSKDVHFKAIDFLEKEFKKDKDFQIVNLKKLSFQKANPFTDEKKRKRLLTAIHHLAVDNRETDAELLNELLIEVQAPNYIHLWR